MSRVLVTGASGFIGRACLPVLAARGHEVHAVTSRSRPAGAGPPGLVWHAADLLDGRAVERLVARVRPSHLLHLAWRPARGRVWTAPDNDAWVRASLTLVRAFEKGGGERAVIAGSCGEYDWTEWPSVEDHTPLRPATRYGECKAAVREALLAGAGGGLSVGWARIFFVYGPGEDPGRLVASAIIGLLRGEPVACTHGRQVRDYLHVDDVADGLVRLLESDAIGAFNLCSGQGVRIREIVDAIGSLIGCPELLQFGARPAPEHEPPVIIGSPDKSAHALGFRPGWSLDRGLEHTLDWWMGALETHVGTPQHT